MSQILVIKKIFDYFFIQTKTVIFDKKYCKWVHRTPRAVTGGRPSVFDVMTARRFSATPLHANTTVTFGSSLILDLGFKATVSQARILDELYHHYIIRRESFYLLIFFFFYLFPVFLDDDVSLAKITIRYTCERTLLTRMISIGSA